MAEYLLDGESRAVDASLDSWGKVLKAVDVDLDRRGRVVTAVRLNGVDQPSFCSANEAGRTVASLGRIEITSCDAAVLLAETIAIAHDSIGELVASARRLAERFAHAHVEEANRDLGELIEAIRTLAVLTAAIADVIEIQRAGSAHLQAADVTEGVGGALHVLSECQAARDWPGTARCLRDELGPAIIRWHWLFDRLERLRTAA